jgi:hypothetical protein
MTLMNHARGPQVTGSQAERQPRTFERHSRSALEALRSAVGSSISACGGDRLNSLQLSRKLGIDKSLAWRLARFAQDEDVFAGSRHLPGDAGLRIFVRAVRSAAGEAAAGSLSESIEALEQVIRDHAGSRAAFRTLLANCGTGAADERAIDYRKAAFQANSAIWGVEANARVMMAFLTAGDAGGTDVALVSGFLGLRRNRRDLSWPVARRRVLGLEGDVRNPRALPLDPSVAEDAPPLLADYSSIRGEGLLPVSTEHGLWYELPDGDIGSAGAVDAVFGERLPGAGPVRRAGIDQPAEVMVRMDLPVEHLLLDVFVGRELDTGADPSSELFGLLSGGSGENTVDRERQRMAMAERPAEIGNDPKHWSSPVSPKHWEMVHDCMRWLDRRPSSFRTFRLHVRWPAIPTAVVVTAGIRGG